MLVKEVKSNVDYITATAKYQEGTNDFYGLQRVVKGELADIFAIGKPWRFYGFHGWRAIVAGHFAYGDDDRGNRAIIQASGSMAARYWQSIAALADNVSRVDIEVDCELWEPDPDLPNAYYDYVERHSVKARKYTLIDATIGGKTLYVGSRSSDQFGRVYDKSAQSRNGKPPGSTWRYEIEFKSKLANEVSKRLLDLYNLKTLEDFYSGIVGTVFDWFNTREVHPVFERSHESVGRIRVDIDHSKGKIAWLRDQVSPTVRRLILSGEGMAAIEALGFLDWFDVSTQKIVRLALTKEK